MSCYRFTSRSPMSYRPALRALRRQPKEKRREWLRQRYLYAEPRVAISRLYGLNV
ncbi:hypothetical protein [Paraburkholderia sp. EG304]|uniref:hypothetical protein n=1 Tax=Paraburkholderia sp. EG304 TaxID=3237015 RepID=UPI003978E21D